MQYAHKAATRAARAVEGAAPAAPAGPWWVAIEGLCAHPPCMDAFLELLDVAGAVRAVLSQLMVGSQGCAHQTVLRAGDQLNSAIKVGPPNFTNF